MDGLQWNKMDDLGIPPISGYLKYRYLEIGLRANLHETFAAYGNFTCKHQPISGPDFPNKTNRSDEDTLW